MNPLRSVNNTAEERLESKLFNHFDFSTNHG